MQDQKPTRETLREGVLRVSHKGLTAVINLPLWLAGCYRHLDNQAELCAWLDNQDLLLEVLHLGLAQAVIRVRAEARTYDKDGLPVINTEAASDYKPKPLPSPAAKKSGMTPEEALDALSPEQLRELLKKKGLT